MDRHEFTAKYTVNFGPLPGDTDDAIQMREWGLLIEQIRPQDLDKLVQQISHDFGKSTKKPRIKDFRVAMAVLRDTVQVVVAGPGCGLCEETGFISVLGWVDPVLPRTDPRRFRVGNMGATARLYICSVPCKCTKGRQIAQRYGIHPDRLAEYHAWFDGFMGECRLTSEPYWLKIRRLERESIEVFGHWPTPGNAKRVTKASEMPQDALRRPMATTVGAVLERVLPATGVMGKGLPEEVEDGIEGEDYLLRTRPAGPEAPAPTW